MNEREEAIKIYCLAEDRLFELMEEKIRILDKIKELREKLTINKKVYI